MTRASLQMWLLILSRRSSSRMFWLPRWSSLLLLLRLLKKLSQNLMRRLRYEWVKCSGRPVAFLITLAPRGTFSSLKDLANFSLTIVFVHHPAELVSLSFSLLSTTNGECYPPMPLRLMIDEKLLTKLIRRWLNSICVGSFEKLRNRYRWTPRQMSWSFDYLLVFRVLPIVK